MYIKKLSLENVGPLAKLDIEPSFENDLPKPLVLVGTNGSGKSIALSFIANFLLHLQQQIFENTEVEKGKVFKLRSPAYIGPTARYYYGSVMCSDGIGLEEWVLSAPKKDLVAQGVAPSMPSWNSISEDQTGAYLPIGDAANPNSPKLKAAYNQNCALYFPPNRFEEPAWLNSRNLSYKPKVSASARIEGITNRQIINSDIFPELVSWIYDIIIDSYVFESREIEFTDTSTEAKMEGFVHINGSNRILRNAIDQVLGMIFERKFQGKLNLGVSPKGARSVMLYEKVALNMNIPRIQNLFSLSSGESLVLSLFTSIIRDFDLGGNHVTSLEDIRGVVLVDEIDVHLHIDLQNKVLPKLLKIFPKVQFIVTTHSPLFLLGMDKEFGASGYDIYSLPSVKKIKAEEFGEFEGAYQEYKNSNHHQRLTQEMLSTLAEPCLITEGKTDRLILQCAWSKLYGTEKCICEIKSSGEIRAVDGSAKHVQSILQYTATLATHPIIGLFDNDREGNGQFNGLKTPLYVEDGAGLKKSTNGKVFGLLLPAPENRQNFVHPSNGNHSFLEIEHYFCDEVLSAQNKRGTEIIAGTGVFEIQGDKNAFAESVQDLSASEFDRFHNLFCRIADILGVQHPAKLA